MVALAATNVTVTITNRLIDVARRGMDKMLNMIDISFGNGVLTYPTGGIPLPDKAQFGYKSIIDFCAIEQPYANGFVYKYDRTNHKLLIYTQGIVMGSSGVSPSGVGAYVENSAGSGTSGQPEIPGTSPDETYDLGALIELPTTIAPASTSLRLLMLGE